MKIVDAIFVYHLVGHARVAWHGRYHAHSCNEYELHFFIDGFGTFLCGKTRYSISPARCFLTMPGEFHSIIPDAAAKPISYYAILFTANEKDDELMCLLNEIREKRAQSLTAQSSYRFYCEDITQLFRSCDTAMLQAAKFAFLSLLFRIFRQHGLLCMHGIETKLEAAQKQTPGHAHVTKALNIMQKNVRKNLGIDEIARIVALSSEHFIRVFRAEVKLTPYQYMLRLKIEGASGLLISTTKTVGEIADWFGFENQFHFSRCFKKCTGVSPVQYRKTYLQNADFNA